MLSICFIVHNRTKVKIDDNEYRMIFFNCLESVKHSINIIKEKNLLDGMEIEICIGDFESTDVEIESWIHDCLKGYTYKLQKFSYHESPFPDGTFFDRGLARNQAGDMAGGEYLFWIDCDMIINENIIINGINANKNNKAYFPICFYNLTKDNLYGWWDVNASGICMLTRHMFEKIRWPEWPEHKSFHAEDSAFLRKANANFGTVRNREPRYFHQFHTGRAVDKVKKRYKRDDCDYPQFININQNGEK